MISEKSVAVNSNSTMKNHKPTGLIYGVFALNMRMIKNFVRCRGHSYNWVEITAEKVKNYQWSSTCYLCEVFDGVSSTDDGNIIKS